MALPPSFRTSLGESCLLSTVGDQRALALWTQEEFTVKAERMQAEVDAGERDANEFRRFVAKVHECRQDSQGRITIPPNYRELADLDRDAVVNGAWKSVELWAPAAWAEINASSDAHGDEL